MDKLLVIEPADLVLKLEAGKRSCGTICLRNVMHTMPVAFKVQPSSSPRKYSVKPPHGIIMPLGTATVEITITLQLPEISSPISDDRFLVKSVVVPGGAPTETVCLDWFTSRRKQVFSDHSLRVFFIGAGILTKLISRGSMEEVRETLERDKAVVNSCDEQGRTPIHIAIASARPELVQLLLELRANVEIRNKAGRTALQEAAAAGQALTVELLLAKGAKTEAKSSSGWTALHYAVFQGHLEVVHLLLIRGSREVNVKTQDGRAPIHMAVVEGHRDCAKLLLAHGADADLGNLEGETALHIAASAGDLGMVQLLVDAGATTQARNRQGKSPLEAARLSGVRNEQLLDLLGHGVMLRWAARKGNLKGIQNSLVAGACINGRDDSGWSALHRAAFKGWIDIVRSLLEKGADIECRDEEGYTALHTATEAAQKEVVQLLLKRGADIHARTNRGATALQIALALNHNKIVRQLIEDGGLSSSLSASIKGFTSCIMMDSSAMKVLSPPQPFKDSYKQQQWRNSTGGSDINKKTSFHPSRNCHLRSSSSLFL